MCLSIVGRQRIPFANPRNVYKVYEVSEGEKMNDFGNSSRGLVVDPPFQGGRFVLYQDQPVKSNRASVALLPFEKRDKDVYKGIHVYLNKAQALNTLRNRTSRAIVVECEAEPKHFVAQEIYDEHHRRAVYKQVTPRKIVAHKDADSFKGSEWVSGIFRSFE